MGWGCLVGWSADLGMELPGNDFALPTIYGAMLTGGGPKRGVRGPGVETVGHGQRPQLPPRAARETRAKARGAAKKRRGAGFIVVLLLTLNLILPYLTDRRRG